MTERVWSVASWAALGTAGLVVVTAIAAAACQRAVPPADSHANAMATSSGTATATATPLATPDPVATTPGDVKPFAMIGDRDAGPVAEVHDAGASSGMLLVAGGTFMMGTESGGEGDEKPAHAVTIASFWLDRTEVTQSAYDACVVEKACPPPDPGILGSFGGLFRGPNKPVNGVSWFAARDYCKWRGKRLPREAEYERAVRGEDGRRFPWGNEPPTHERTVFEANATEDVGTHPTGRGPYGHDDLAGNVWEWIEDDYDPFAYSRPGAAEGKPGTCDEILAAQNKLRAENKQGFTGSNPIPTECEKSIRGGAYNYPAGGLRSSNRIHHPPSFKLRMTGIRCAKDE